MNHAGARTVAIGRRLDWPLLAAFLGVVLLLALALYGPLVAPHDFYFTRTVLDGRAPPYAPSPMFPLGSDDAGHDLLSWLLIGARTTLVIAFGAAALRIVLGGFLGAFAAWQGGRSEAVLTRAALAFSSIPATVLGVLGVIAFNVYAGALGFAVALGVLGWGDAFLYTRRQTRAEASRAFIESARAQGMTETRVVVRHLLPGIAPSVLTLAGLQTAAVLLVLGELGLLRLFVGGATVVDFDIRSGAPQQVMPAQPDWSSMLAGTRPITSLYGAPWTVLVPGIALLAAVLLTTLLADTLAQRARLDLYRLLDWRTSALALGLVVVIATPALVWPGPLAPDIAAASALHGARALQVGRELSDARFDGRLVGSRGALEAATWISLMWQGQVMAHVGETVRVTDGFVHAGPRALQVGPDLAALSLNSQSISGTLRDLDREPPTTVRSGSLAGRILVVSPRSRFAPSASTFATQADAAGLLIVDDDLGAYAPNSAHAVPTFRVGTAAFRELFGALPVSLDDQAAPLPASLRVDLMVRVSRSAVPTANVVADAPASRPEPGLVLVLAAYDEATYPHSLALRPAWNSASAVGVATEVLAAIRRSPLPADIRFVALGAESLGSTGTAALVSSLGPGPTQRVVAAVVVGSLQSGQPYVQVQQADRANPADVSPSQRVGGRVADALGLRTRPGDLPIRQVLRAGSVVAPVVGLSDLQGPDANEPSRDALASSARALYVLLSYIARHPEELRP